MKGTSCKVFLWLQIALIMTTVSRASQAHDSNAFVITQMGPIQGLREVISNAHGSVQMIKKFLGIPYAMAPIGNLRFSPPEAHKGWKGTVYKATSFKNICMQMIHHYRTSIHQAWESFSETENIDEDCLYLNVYTPANATMANHSSFPVLAYIHGGGFFAGTPIRAVSPGEYLALRGMIVVTIQYRLGPFGFFSTGDSRAPGNYGMLDQVEALKWINKNIETFGGDPSRVTLFGESAGGASANLHLLSSLSQGLFHRVITESGTDLSPFAFHDSSGVSQSSRDLAEKLNCTDVKTDLMLKCLRSKKAKEVLKFSGGGLFYPVVDNHFLADSPINLRKAGKFQKLPTLAGFVSNEGSFLLGPSPQEFDKYLFRSSVEMYIVNGISHSEKRKPLLVDAVLFQYSHWPCSKNNSSKIRQSLIDALTDYFIAAPTHASLAFQSRYAPTWLFEFRHRSLHSPNKAWEGVAHGDITPYVFGVPLLNRSVPHPYTEADRNVSEFMVSAYTNFVKEGVPSPVRSYRTEWRNFKPYDQAYLRIEATSHMAKDFQPLKVAFWNEYFPQLCKSVMSCEGHGIAATKSSSCANKLYKLLISLVVISWVAIQ